MRFMYKNRSIFHIHAFNAYSSILIKYVLIYCAYIFESMFWLKEYVDDMWNVEEIVIIYIVKVKQRYIETIVD